MSQQVISASRRTDIPAFYSDWFLNRLADGFCDVLHPYTKQWFRVSLMHEDVGAIVFWSKNYSPLLPKLAMVERTTKNIIFHFTITANDDLELRTPDHRDAIKDYIHITRRYSPDHAIWRFDPICITDKLSFEMHEERFAACAELLRGHTSSCVISFAHPYRKMMSNLKKYTSHMIVPVTREAQRTYADRLAARAASYGIRLLACCNDHLLSSTVGKTRCIDGAKLSLLFGAPLDTRSAASRKECGCTKSIDIGAYDTCGHGCVYCYANTDQEKANRAQAAIDPSCSALSPAAPIT
jgi:hypothetical protein